MFELTKEEYDFLRCNFFTLKKRSGTTQQIPALHFYTGRHLKEQDKLSIQIDNINDAIAKLQAEENQKMLNTQNKKIGFVMRK